MMLHSVSTNERVETPVGRSGDHLGAVVDRMNKERRIPPVAEDALELLRESVADDGSGLAKDEATGVLVADERFTEGDAEYVLDVLQSRGYIYSVDEQVRITPTDD